MEKQELYFCDIILPWRLIVKKVRVVINEWFNETDTFNRD